MFVKIELHNFQCYKDTVIDFSDGVNAICGESDNGKSAVIRAIRWVVENRPSGVDKLNSHWNKDFKQPMSVKLYTENGWVERIRTKDRNGYNICYNDKEPIELSAVRTDVPQEIKDFLNLTDVNFQYQFDSPYLISMTAGDASKYLNEIIHLDSIDKILSVAESTKRNINSEIKVVDTDIDKVTKELEKLDWVDDAVAIQKRIDKYDEILEVKGNALHNLQLSIHLNKDLQTHIINLDEQKKLCDKIESIQIPDNNRLKTQIKDYQNCKNNIFDFSLQKKLCDKIESIQIPDNNRLKTQIDNYSYLNQQMINLRNEISKLQEQLPDVCPYCGNSIIKCKD